LWRRPAKVGDIGRRFEARRGERGLDGGDTRAGMGRTRRTRSGSGKEAVAR
jgi:hypothetical protein